MLTTETGCAGALGSGTIFEDENGARPLANKGGGPVVCRAHQHLRPGLCRRGVAGVPGARWTPGDRRRRRSREARPDPQSQVAHPRRGHPGTDARRGRFRPRVGDRRCHAGHARYRNLVRLRGHAVGRERQPGPHRDPAARRAARCGAGAQGGVPHHRHPLDGAAGHGGREDRAHSRARQRQEVGRRLRLVLPARVPARGLIDPRLRSSAVHHRRRQLRSGGQCGARSVPASRCALPRHEHSRGRSAQDEPAMPFTRSRSPSPTKSAASRRRWASIRTRSCAWSARTSA